VILLIAACWLEEKGTQPRRHFGCIQRNWRYPAVVQVAEACRKWGAPGSAPEANRYAIGRWVVARKV